MSQDLFRTGELKVIPQCIDQRAARLNLHDMLRAVDVERDALGRHGECLAECCLIRA
jgi:hypothetical protein